MKTVLRLCAGALGGAAGAVPTFYVCNAALFAMGSVSVHGVSPSVLISPVLWAFGGAIGALTCSLPSRRLAASVGALVGVTVYVVATFRTMCTVPLELAWVQASTLLCHGLILGAVSAVVAQTSSAAFLRWIETGSVSSELPS